MDTDVIVVGAGPTGLMLACELALAGVRTTVLEQREQRSEHPRGGGIQPRTAEMLDLRGLMPALSRFLVPRGEVGGHFAGLPVQLDCRSWGTRYPYPIHIPQPRLEDVLEEHAGQLGVRVNRGSAIVGIDHDDRQVTATVQTRAGTSQLRACYLAACDGGRSTLRRLLDVAFPGEPGTSVSTLADIRLASVSELVPTESGHFSTMYRRTDEYGCLLNPLGGDRYRFVFGSTSPNGASHSAPVTEQEVSEALRAVYGADTELAELRSASRFTDATRQIDRYRVGRVLFAGDAAHIHPPFGGQGLNLGMQDAMNLGWKLALHLRGRAPERLLDSYHDERHPVGARVLHNTRAQAVLGAPSTPQVKALRDIFTELLRLPEANTYIAGMIAGLDIRYPMPGGGTCELVGARMPDVDLAHDGTATAFSELAHAGRGVLVTRDGDSAAARTMKPWSDRVDVTAADITNVPDVAAVLVRPDGYVCWASESGNDATGLADALDAWFGAPAEATC